MSTQKAGRTRSPQVGLSYRPAGLDHSPRVTRSCPHRRSTCPSLWSIATRNASAMLADLTRQSARRNASRRIRVGFQTFIGTRNDDAESSEVVPRMTSHGPEEVSVVVG